MIANYLRCGAAMAALLLACGAGPAPAQEPGGSSAAPDESRHRALDIDDPSVYPQVTPPADDLPPARLEICFDPVSRIHTLAVEPNEPFDIYLLAHDSRWGVRGWEAKLDFDERLQILETKFEGVNVGQGQDWFVGIVPAKCFLGSTAVLARFKAVVTDPDATDLVLGLAPTDRSSFDPPSPGYLVCKPDNQLLPYVGCETCAVVNPVSLHPEDDSSRPGKNLFEPVRGKVD